MANNNNTPVQAKVGKVLEYGGVCVASLTLAGLGFVPLLVGAVIWRASQVVIDDAYKPKKGG
jgi:hypothetical protein